METLTMAECTKFLSIMTNFLKEIIRLFPYIGHDQHGQVLPLGGGGGGLHYPHVAQSGGGNH
jgi:hypothetical protein